MQKMEKVILKSLLKETTLVKYLKGIENHQLNVELPSGKVHFRKLEFNNEEINKLLGGSGWTVNNGSVDEAYLQIPWQQLLENGCSIKLRKIRLQIAYNRPEKPEVVVSKTSSTNSVSSTSSSISSSLLESSISWGMGSSLLFGGENLANSQFLRNSVNLQEEEEVAAVGLDVLAKTIEKIFSRVEATVEDLVLNVQFYSKRLDKWILAVLTFPFLEYVNAEPVNKGVGDLVVAKMLRIRSFNIELGEVDSPNGTSSSLETVINGQPTSTGETFQIRFQQKQSEGLPRQIDGSLGNIGILLTPKTLELLLAILESDSSPSGDSTSKSHSTKPAPFSIPQDIVKRSSHRVHDEPMQTTPSQSPGGNSVPDHEYITASEDESEEEEEIEDEFLECEDQIYQGMLKVPSVYISLQSRAMTLGLCMKNVIGSYQQSTMQTMIKFAAHDVSLTESRDERQETLLSFVPLEKYLLPSEELTSITSPLLFQRQTQSNIEVCVRYSQKDSLTTDKEYLVLLDETHIRWDAYTLQRLETLVSEFLPSNPSTLPPSSASPGTGQKATDADLSESLIQEKKYTRTIINAKAPSVLITTRFPDVRPGAAKGALREEALFIDIFQPKLQSVLFSDQTSTSIIVDFDQLRATLKKIDEGYQPPIFEAQTKNTLDEVNSPIEITINSSASIREAALNAHQTPDPAETEHFRFHATATAKTSIRLILPSSELSVTKYSWDLLNELLDVIVLPSPPSSFDKEAQRLAELRREKQEDTEERRYEQPSYEEEEMEDDSVIGPSGLALSIFFVRGKWLFKENKSEDRNKQRFVYLVDYSDLSYFTVYQYLGRSLSHTIISMENVSIYELLQQSASNVSTLVIHRNPFLRPLIKKNPAFLALIQKTSCDKSARLAFSEVLFEASPTSTYASRLFNFFTDSEASDPEPSSSSSASSSSSSSSSTPPSSPPSSSIKKSNYFIVFNEASLRYRVPEELDHHGTSAMLVLHSLDALIPIEPNTPFRTQLSARDAVLLLGKVGTLREHHMEGSFEETGEFFEGNEETLERDYRHNPRTLVDYWKREGYRDVVHFGPVLEVAVKTGQTDPDQPKTQVSLTNHLNPLEISLCSDSLAAIHELIQSFSSTPPKATEEPSQGPKPTNKAEKPLVEESFPRPPDFNLFSNIDKKAFETAPTSSSSSLKKSPPSTFQTALNAFVSTSTSTTVSQDAVFVEDYDEAPSFGWGKPASPSLPQKDKDKETKKAGGDDFVMVTTEPTVRKLVENTSMADFIIDDYIDPQGNDDPEESLKLPKGFPSSITRFVVRDFSLAIKLHTGKEWPPLGTHLSSSSSSSTSSMMKEEGSSVHDSATTPTTEMDTGSTTSSSSGSGSTTTTKSLRASMMKDEERYMRIDLEKISSQMDFFGEGQKYRSRFSLLVHEVKVDDSIVQQQAEGSSKTWWLSFDEEYNRDRNAVMLSIELDCVRPDFELLPHREEYRLKFSVLPLHFHGSQDSVDFLKQFATEVKQLTSSTPTTSQPQPHSPLHPPAPATEDQMFFQLCSIKSLRVRADYEPTRFLASNLLHGDYGELLNAFVLEGAIINLNHLKLQAINGWGSLFNAMQKLWLSQVINIQQMYDVVAGVKRVRPIMVLGGAAADMVRQVVEQYRQDGRVLLALQRGGSSFYTTLVNQVGGIGFKSAANFLGGWVTGTSPTSSAGTNAAGSTGMSSSPGSSAGVAVTGPEPDEDD